MGKSTSHIFEITEIDSKLHVRYKITKNSTWILIKYYFKFVSGDQASGIWV